jgi:D-threo-aldose 1-dehydrogenase
MRYRTFGRTGLEVSELVFGGGWVGGILIHQDDDTKLQALKGALAGGINFIDTAPSYGDGRSEEALGWLLREVDERPYLSTKVRIDPGRLDDIPGQIEASLSASLRRLRRDSVDLLQLHNHIRPETTAGALGVDRVLGKGSVADGLERLREQGLTRFIGITALGDGAACRRVIESGRFDSAQVYHNLLNPSAARTMPPGWSGQDFGGLIAACRAQGVAVMNIRVLAAGVLAADERHGRENPVTENAELAEEERRARAVFQALGTEYGTRAQTAIRFALANPDIACVIVGLAELSHLEEALAAAEMGPLPEEALAKLERLYATDFGRL